jgi:TonB family protein
MPKPQRHGGRMATRTALRFFLSTCCVILLAPATNAQEKSSTAETSTAAHADEKASTPWDDSSSLRTQSGDPVYKVGNGVTPPHVKKSPSPKYIKDAKAANIQGRVVLWIIVNTQGMPEQIKIKKSLDPGLDQSAVEAVSHWRFAPATKDGQPVAAMINVEVNFRLY